MDEPGPWKNTQDCVHVTDVKRCLVSPHLGVYITPTGVILIQVIKESRERLLLARKPVQMSSRLNRIRVEPPLRVVAVLRHGHVDEITPQHVPPVPLKIANDCRQGPIFRRDVGLRALQKYPA
jgi:hypothetical protein